MTESILALDERAERTAAETAFEPAAKRLPVPDEASRPFFAAALREQLVVLRCDACGTFMSPTAGAGTPYPASFARAIPSILVRIAVRSASSSHAREKSCGSRIFASDTATICFTSTGSPVNFGRSSSVIALAGLPRCRFGRSGSSFSDPTPVTEAESSFFRSRFISSAERRFKVGRSGSSALPPSGVVLVVEAVVVVAPPEPPESAVELSPDESLEVFFER